MRPGRSLSIWIAVAFFIFILVPPSLAQEGYNYGTMQADRANIVAPGETWTTKLYVFNEGTRVTHVKAWVGSAPGVNVTLDPSLRTIVYDVGGVPRPVEESLCVNPKGAQGCQRPDGTDYPPGDPLPAKPAQSPEGIEYVQLAADGKTVYSPARVLNITITVPKTAALGTTYPVRIDTQAFWLGALGTVSLEQARSFEYTVTAAQRDFVERPVKTAPPGQSPTTEGGRPGASGPGTTTVVEREVTSPLLLGVVAAMGIAVAALFGLRVLKK